jgi:AcrR family transcriptional regulator
MTTQAGILDQGLLAALEIAATKPWADLTLSGIAEAAGIGLSEFHAIAGKDELASHADLYFDRFMSEEGVSPDESPRERLFDVIMLRFEAMEQHRAGLVSLMTYRDRTPSLLLTLPLARKRTADWALVSAGLDNRSGAPTGLKAVAIAFVIDKAERAWGKDTSGDFALTMAALDKGLRDAEDRMEQLQRFTGWGKRNTRQDNTADEETKPEET